MTVTDQIAFLRKYTGSTRKSADFPQSWQAALSVCGASYSVKIENLDNPMGIYETVMIPVNNRTLTAHCIRPADGRRHPMVLMYHDLNRGVRGWFHMTRFLAFGCGVVAPAAEVFPGAWESDLADFRGRFLDALILGNAALQLPWVDQKRVTAWGEGFGGGLALAAASLLPGIKRTAVLNPMPGDLRSMGITDMDDVDLVNFAPLLQGQLLFGTCLLDRYAPPKAQAAVYNAINCEKFWRIYPKYGHERVNAFENDLVRFLHSGLDGFQNAASAGLEP